MRKQSTLFQIYLNFSLVGIKNLDGKLTSLFGKGYNWDRDLKIRGYFFFIYFEKYESLGAKKFENTKIKGHNNIHKINIYLIYLLFDQIAITKNLFAYGISNRLF